MPVYRNKLHCCTIPFVANVTRIGSLACMDTLVSVKATLLGETLLANLTLVWSLTSVRAHVHLQVWLATETSLTHLQTFYNRKLMKKVSSILCLYWLEGSGALHQTNYCWHWPPPSHLQFTQNTLFNHNVCMPSPF